MDFPCGGLFFFLECHRGFTPSIYAVYPHKLLLLETTNLYAISEYQLGSDSTRCKLVPSKIIHWIIFEFTFCLQSAFETFLQEKKVSSFQKHA